MFDTIIIGGGPAGISAGIYAARKKLNSLLISDSLTGQSVVSSDIENWIGEKHLTGQELFDKLQDHLKAQKSIEIITGTRVVEIKKKNNLFEVKTKNDKNFQSKTIIVCTGGSHRKLNVPGEEKFSGKGVSYCATCDAPLFKDKVAAVIGSGNAGLEAIIDLAEYAKKIYLLDIADHVTGDPLKNDKIKKMDKTEIILNSRVKEILGDKKVTGIRYFNKKQDKDEELKLDGIFVEIGTVPNSKIVKGLVKLNKKDQIVINHKTGETSKEAIFSGGDVTDEIYQQNNIAAGDAIKAALSAYYYLLEK